MFKAYQNIDISTTPSPSLTLAEIGSNVEGYRCIGSGTNFTLTLTGSPLVNMATFILWEATITSPTLGNVTIFGNDMPAEFQTKKTLVTCTYDGTAWQVVFNISGDESGYIIDANVASNAAIARTKIANGTADHVVINNGSGTLSSEAQLANTRGGTGKNMSADTGVVKVSSGTFSASTIVNADVASNAAIAYSKLATLNTGQIVVGNGGIPTAVTMSGDATVDAAGVVTVAGDVGMFEPGAGSDSLKDKRASTSSGNSGTAIGLNSINSANAGMAIGQNAENSASSGLSLGHSSSNSGASAQALGHSSINSGQNAQAIGNAAENTGDFAQAIGFGAKNYSNNATALGYMADNSIEKTTNISGPIMVRKGDGAGDLDTFQFYAGSEVIIMTGTFDAKTLGTQEITFPTGVRMFVNEVGFIATTANTVTIQPQLSYGISGNTAALLATALTTGITAAGARDRQLTLLLDSGVTSLAVEVQVAATATSLVGRAYFKGFIVENQ